MKRADSSIDCAPEPLLVFVKVFQVLVRLTLHAYRVVNLQVVGDLKHSSIACMS